MRAPFVRSLRLYLSNQVEDLYQGAASRLPNSIHRRPRTVSPLYLCEGRHLFWALIYPLNPYMGRIAHSNVLPSGTLVRSMKSWPYAAMRREPSHPQTLVSPRFLKILWLPPSPKCGKGERLSAFSLVA